METYKKGGKSPENTPKTTEEAKYTGVYRGMVCTSVFINWRQSCNGTITR